MRAVPGQLVAQLLDQDRLCLHLRQKPRGEAAQLLGAEALSQGVHSADVILNILSRRRDPEPPPLLLTSPALRLTYEPVADCARYDLLRRVS